VCSWQNFCSVDNNVTVFYFGGTKTLELFLRTPDVPEEFCIVLFSSLLFRQSVEFAGISPVSDIQLR
jgi:hypothetical protein